MSHFLFWRNLYFASKKPWFSQSIQAEVRDQPTTDKKTIDIKITTQSGLSIASHFQFQFRLTSLRRQILILFPRFSLRRISNLANVVRFWWLYVALFNLYHIADIVHKWKPFAIPQTVQKCTFQGDFVMSEMLPQFVNIFLTCHLLLALGKA